MYSIQKLNKTGVLLGFIFLFLSSAPLLAQGDAANGRKLFKSNCAACHKLDKDLVGPALAGITETRSEEWLVAWIKDNAALRASGDADAIAVFEKYNGSPMSAFPFLSDQDIKDILQYTIEGDPKPVITTEEGGGEQAAAKDYSLEITIFLGLILIVMLLLLARMKNTLRIVSGQEPQSILDELGWFWGRLANNKGFVTVATFIIGVLFLYATFNYLMGIGVEKNYQPAQPIAFSHKLHAGENQIDCNYCHSSARHSKTSGIPSTNVCMNCHMYVDGSEIKDDAGELKYGGDASPEIAKIYAAIGWDAEKREYIEGYEKQPIKWVRIHNLPDLSYFNHSQHVNAAELECQTCHGPVEEMEEVYQYSDLTMGWCVNCHRDTEVKFESNEYYTEFHDKMNEKYHGEKITAEKIGGLECGKCHY